MTSIFSKIIDGEIPCHRIEEDDYHLAFLDINPLKEGHTLVIPKKVTDYLFDIDHEEYQSLWSFAQKVAQKIKQSIPCKKIGVAVVGLEVAHAHIHLIPINSVSDMNFANPKLNISHERLAEIAAIINR